MKKTKKIIALLLCVALTSLPFVANISATANSTFLPDGYTQIEYIETDGTQFIDTNFSFKDKGTDEFLIVFDGEFIGHTNPKSNGYLYGVRGSDVNYRIGFCFKDASSGDTSKIDAFAMMCGIGVGRVWYSRYVPSIGQRFVVSGYYTPFNSKSSECYLNGEMLMFGDNTQQSGAVSHSVRTLFLFACNNQDSEYFYGKLYGFSIFADGLGYLVNMIPCIRDGDSAIGLYDTVRNEFFTDNNGKPFEGGEVVKVDTPPTLSNASNLFISSIDGIGNSLKNAFDGFVYDDDGNVSKEFKTACEYIVLIGSVGLVAYTFRILFKRGKSDI